MQLPLACAHLHFTAALMTPAASWSSASGQDELATVAEASEYKKTATHEEVLDFLTQLRRAGSGIRVEIIGQTTEGRPLPLVIAGDPAPADPVRAARSARPLVCVQANIHAGEVCGKEAILALLRDLTLGRLDSGVLSQVDLLVIPDYNPDGNERFDDVARNRRGQVGPERVGKRHNGGNLDLNRDYMKVESPECRAVMEQVFRRWDPDVFIDLHTTNGSYHGYQLTYAPSLFPVPGETPGNFIRNQLLPHVRQRLRDEQKLEIFDYGNMGRGDEPRWTTYDHRPRYGTNYAALRGRMSVLSESYSYADFETRVRATYHFVHEILRFIGEHSEEVLRLNRDHDRRVTTWGMNPDKAPQLGVRFQQAPRDTPEDILAEVIAPPAEGERRGRRTGKIEPRTMQVFDRFVATRAVSFPAGFMVPASQEAILKTLAIHGVRVERLERDFVGEVEVFVPTKVNTSRRSFAGASFLLEGERKLEERTVRRGSFYVTTAQPLGLLAFYLLDPETDDGAVNWRMVDPTPEVDKELPYYRVMEPPVEY